MARPLVGTWILAARPANGTGTANPGPTTARPQRSTYRAPGPAVWRGYPRECTLFKAQRALARVKAPLAQSVERFHGKEKVNGSIPLGSSVVAELLQGAERHPDGGVAQLVRAHDS